MRRTLVRLAAGAQRWVQSLDCEPDPLRLVAPMAEVRAWLTPGPWLTHVLLEATIGDERYMLVVAPSGVPAWVPAAALTRADAPQGQACWVTPADAFGSRVEPRWYPEASAQETDALWWQVGHEGEALLLRRWNQAEGTPSGPLRRVSAFDVVQTVESTPEPSAPEGHADDTLAVRPLRLVEGDALSSALLLARFLRYDAAEGTLRAPTAPLTLGALSPPGEPQGLDEARPTPEGASPEQSGRAPSKSSHQPASQQLGQPPILLTSQALSPPQGAPDALPSLPPAPASGTAPSAPILQVPQASAPGPTRAGTESGAIAATSPLQRPSAIPQSAGHGASPLALQPTLYAEQQARAAQATSNRPLSNSSTPEHRDAASPACDNEFRRQTVAKTVGSSPSTSVVAPLEVELSPQALPRIAPGPLQALPTLPPVPPGSPQTLPVLPKTSPVPPQASPTPSQASPVLPQASPTTPQTSPVLPQALPASPQALSAPPQASPARPLAPRTLPLAAPGLLQALPDLLNAPSGSSKASAALPQAPRGGAQASTVLPQAPQATQATPRAPLVVPQAPLVVPQAPPALLPTPPALPKASSGLSKASPALPQAPLSPSQASPVTPQASPVAPQTPPVRPQALPALLHASLTRSHGSPTLPQALPVLPPATSSPAPVMQPRRSTDDESQTAMSAALSPQQGEAAMGLSPRSERPSWTPTVRADMTEAARSDARAPVRARGEARTASAPPIRPLVPSTQTRVVREEVGSPLAHGLYASAPTVSAEPVHAIGAQTTYEPRQVSMAVSTAVSPAVASALPPSLAPTPRQGGVSLARWVGQGHSNESSLLPVNVLARDEGEASATSHAPTVVRLAPAAPSWPSIGPAVRPPIARAVEIGEIFVEVGVDAVTRQPRAASPTGSLIAAIPSLRLGGGRR